LVLERVDGETMHDALARDASGEALTGAAHELARLHDDLHAVSRDGAALVHRDLHWKNVLETAGDPVLIDWANAGWGDASLDRALTWVILETSSGALGRMLADRFADIADTTTARRRAVMYRLGDLALFRTRAGRRSWPARAVRAARWRYSSPSARATRPGS
jgi:tRNA A-37 threonylcarbamoyl transferase component Bud32